MMFGFQYSQNITIEFYYIQTINQYKFKQYCCQQRKYNKMLNKNKVLQSQKTQKQLLSKKPKNNLTLHLLDEGSHKFKQSKGIGRKISITVNQSKAQINESKQLKQNIPNFCETIQNVNDQKNKKAFWISKRGSINFYLMENQDHIISYENESIRMYGILDGNGKYGKKIAQDMGDRIIKFFSQNQSKQKQNKKYNKQNKFTNKNLNPSQKINIYPNQLKSLKIARKNSENKKQKQNQQQFTEEQFKSNLISFIQSQNIKMMKNYAQPYKSSGCTLLLIIVSKTKIYSFNIGASKSFLFRSLSPNYKKISGFPIATEQTLFRFDEKSRIISSPLALIEKSMDQNNNGIGPERIWKKGQKFPGLAITRCLGMEPQILNSLGIISEPECLAIDIKQNFQFILLGSDGFWKVFRSQEQIIRIIEMYWLKNKLSLGLEELLQQAVIKWNNRYQLMDDISVIIILIK